MDYDFSAAGHHLAGQLGGVSEEHLTLIYKALEEAYDAGSQASSVTTN